MFQPSSPTALTLQDRGQEENSQHCPGLQAKDLQVEEWVQNLAHVIRDGAEVLLNASLNVHFENISLYFCSTSKPSISEGVIANITRNVKYG